MKKSFLSHSLVFACVIAFGISLNAQHGRPAGVGSSLGAGAGLGAGSGTGAGIGANAGVGANGNVSRAGTGLNDSSISRLSHLTLCSAIRTSTRPSQPPLGKAVSPSRVAISRPLALVSSISGSV